MKPDRTTAPPVHGVDKIEFTEPFRRELKGGTTLFSLPGEAQEVVKLDMIFQAGNWYEAAKLQGVMAASMISEGTPGKSALDIADRIDFLGAQFSSVPHYDNNYVSLLALKKHLPQLLPLLGEMLREANFPEKEFEIIRQKKKQRAIIDREKVGLLAQRHFLRELMGPSHPYAPIDSPDRYDEVTRDGSFQHYRQHYNAANATIFLSGDIDETVERLISEHLGDAWGEQCPSLPNRSFPDASPVGYQFLEKKDANQNALFMGKKVPPQDHPDAAALKFVTSILGGYFGSRLMSNLRESKGLTYGISASVVHFVRETLFLIHAEITAAKTDLAIQEICHELERLRAEPVEETELAPLRSYLMGRMLEDFDGPFARDQSFMSLYEAGLPTRQFDHTLHTIRTITPGQIQEIAQKYLDPASLLIVGVGKK
ncbi:MAG: insulinase family protein [Marinilabiliales bacterium]|nr:insulinase family protein [Marinilabiliales bacterium]